MFQSERRWSHNVSEQSNEISQLCTTINQRRPKPWRTMFLPCRRDTSWALLLLEAAASISIAQSLRWAAALTLWLTVASRSISRGACCLTAWSESWRRRSRTRADSKASLDTALLLTWGDWTKLPDRLRLFLPGCRWPRRATILPVCLPCLGLVLRSEKVSTPVYSSPEGSWSHSLGVTGA